MKSTPKSAFVSFKKTVKTLQLSTITSKGKPNASYSPFVQDDAGNFYIFVSQLASHTHDLIKNPEASILLIEDESNSKQIFARQRITFQCAVEIITSKNSDYELMLDALEKRFGNMVELLRTLSDFILFRLTPYKGQYVQGFGKAYKLEGDGLLELEHITAQEINNDAK